MSKSLQASTVWATAATLARAISIKYLKGIESLIGVYSMRARVTLIIVFGIIQSLMAFSAMTLACVLYFNLFDAQSLWNIPQEAINFHLVILLTFGVFLIASGLFLVNDWRESHK
jgi:hypothetical protein